MAVTRAVERALQWLQDPAYDKETQEEVRRLLLVPERLEEAFGGELSFGTAGLRALMGVGTNRINLYTIGKVTQGIARYIQKHGTPNRGVVVGFDSRHLSPQLAEQVSRILIGNGIVVYSFRELRPTPFVSFACRYLRAQAAIMITASHNPKEYNGYKVYWENGGQVTAVLERALEKEIRSITSPSQVQLGDLSSSLLRVMGGLEEAYVESIQAFQLFPHADRTDFSITYTSLHGTGICLMPQVLHGYRFRSLHLVASQITPDGDFPTVEVPNPEHPHALKVAVEDFENSQADLLLVTDPDADRIRVVARHHQRSIPLTGNELAAIGAYFLCQTLRDQDRLQPNSAIVITLVTTSLIQKIAQFFQVRCFTVPVGFKHISETIASWDSISSYHFLFAAEESYGFLLGTHSLDKDGIGAGAFFAEIACQMKLQGKTLIDLLYEIYAQFGIVRERQWSLSFEEGNNVVSEVMNFLRCNRPKRLGGKTIVDIQDLLVSSAFPKGDLLILHTEEQCTAIIRPSGTEPKIKIYLSTHLECFDSVEQGVLVCEQRLQEWQLQMEHQIRGWISQNLRGCLE